MLASLASRPLAAFPVFRAGRLPHHSFRGLRSVHIVAARVVAEPPRAPLSSECFSRCRYLHRPLRLLPAGATVAGRDSHPLRNGTLSRRTRTNREGGDPRRHAARRAVAAVWRGVAPKLEPETRNSRGRTARLPRPRRASGAEVLQADPQAATSSAALDIEPDGCPRWPPSGLVGGSRAWHCRRPCRRWSWRPGPSPRADLDQVRIENPAPAAAPAPVELAPRPERPDQERIFPWPLTGLLPPRPTSRAPWRRRRARRPRRRRD